MIEKHWPSAHRSADISNMVGTLAPALFGHDPVVVGAVLGELVAIFIAGHPPSLRDTARRLLIDHIDDLIPVVAEEMIEEGIAPRAWRLQ